MHKSELDELVKSTALLMERYQHLCKQMGQQQAQQAGAINAVVKSLPGQLRSSIDATLAGASREGADAMKQTMQAAVNDYEQRLAASGESLGRNVSTLVTEIERLRRASRGVLLKSLGLVVAATVLLVAGTIWLGGRYRAEIERNQIQAELLRAYNRADVVLCGKEQLCANVDMRGSGTGEKGRYRRVRPRP